jgi:hypothetical protein
MIHFLIWIRFVIQIRHSTWKFARAFDSFQIFVIHSDSRVEPLGLLFFSVSVRGVLVL